MDYCPWGTKSWTQLSDFNFKGAQICQKSSLEKKMHYERGNLNENWLSDTMELQLF